MPVNIFNMSVYHIQYLSLIFEQLAITVCLFSTSQFYHTVHLSLLKSNPLFPSLSLLTFCTSYGKQLDGKLQQERVEEEEYKE